MNDPMITPSPLTLFGRHFTRQETETVYHVFFRDETGPKGDVVENMFPSSSWGYMADDVNIPHEAVLHDDGAWCWRTRQ